MEPADDSYYTIAAPAEAIYKDKGSKFLAYAWPVTDERQIRDALDGLRKRYYDATHHCYAWRLGPEGENVRMNDDGEPSSTAGRPILGQLLSRQRMQDAHVGFGIFQHTVFEDINVLHAFVLHRIGETFALHAGHVDDIGVAERLFNAAGFGVRNPFPA